MIYNRYSKVYTQFMTGRAKTVQGLGQVRPSPYMIYNRYSKVYTQFMTGRAKTVQGLGQVRPSPYKIYAGTAKSIHSL